MPLFLSGSNGVSGADGTAALPAVQGTDGNTGVFFPAADQVAIATGGVQRLLVDASGIVTGTAGNLMLVSGTAQASTSGTNIDFTGIPSWARRVTVVFNSVSTNGTNALLVQAGTSAGVVSSGYLGAQTTGTNTIGTINFTAGFQITFGAGADAASSVRHGTFILTNVSGNSWTGTGMIAYSDTARMSWTAGSIALAGVLDRIRITTVGGTDTFDAGSINILFE